MKVMDFGFDEPSQIHFLALELIDGIDLRGLLRKHGTLPVDVVVYAGTELGCARETRTVCSSRNHD